MRDAVDHRTAKKSAQEHCSDDTASELRDPVTDRFEWRENASEHKSQSNRRIYVRARDATE
jgi:hypothetical protein